MTQADASEAKLPRRDWVVLPLLSILTVLLVCVCVEWSARRMFTESAEEKRSCTPYIDPYLGIARPANCSFRSKELESGWVDQKLNSKGYRDSELSPKQPGTYRIVLIGSSFGVSGATAREKTFAALLPTELSLRTGRKVELYNESIAGFPGLPQNLDRRFDDVLAAKPDLILWALTRWDIKAVLDTAPDPAPGDGPAPPRQAVDLADQVKNFLSSSKEIFTESRSALLLRSILARSQSQSIESTENAADGINGYLKANYSAEWRERLQSFETDFVSIKEKATAANVPLVVVLLPSAGQTAMISASRWSASFDPYQLDNELSSIVTRHGGTYVEISPDYKDTAHPERGFLPVDGHPNAEGNATIARFLTKDLTARAVPALEANGQDGKR